MNYIKKFVDINKEIKDGRGLTSGQASNYSIRRSKVKEHKNRTQLHWKGVKNRREIQTGSMEGTPNRSFGEDIPPLTSNRCHQLPYCVLELVRKNKREPFKQATPISLTRNERSLSLFQEFSNGDHVKVLKILNVTPQMVSWDFIMDLFCPNVDELIIEEPFQKQP